MEEKILAAKLKLQKKLNNNKMWFIFVDITKILQFV
jgi:hypothetical protein